MAVQTETEDACRYILADLEDDFLQSIHPPSVLRTLFAKGLVSNVQRDEIQTAAKSVSRYQACSLLTAALRQLPKGTNTPKIFYRVLQGVRGHESIAEKMRKAFTDHGIDITEEPVTMLPLSHQGSAGQDDEVQSTSTVLTKPVKASDQEEYPHLLKPSRPFQELLGSPVRPDVPTPPEHVSAPTDVENLIREFSRLLRSTFEVVSTLPRLKLRSLHKLLGSLLRENCFGKAKELPTDAEEIAELVTSEDQDFVNYVVLREAIGMVNNEELSKMLTEYEEKLKLHKEKCLYESVQQTKKLEEDGDVVIVRMGHKDKSKEEFQFSHVIAERLFLVDVTGIARVTFKGFTSGSVYLYFSMPEDSVYLLIPALRDNLAMLQQWGVTDVTVYNYFTFSLIDEDSFVSWRPEIDKKLKGEKDQMSVAADHVKMTNRMRNKSGGDKGRHSVSSVDVLLLKNQSLVSSDVGNVCEAEAEDLGALAHEAELEKLCWIPFGIQTLTVGEEGGLFPLQPQTTEVYKDNDVITLEVPEGAVNTAVCDRLCIRYGVIVFGPFDLPEGYQLGSMAVYIYFNQDYAVKPVVLHLPHWSGKDGETGLKCVVAPHRLEEGEEKYKFKDVEEGDFQLKEGCHLITIDDQCSLFADALKEETSLKYYATGHERNDEKGTCLDVVITCASQVWLEILQEYRCPVSRSALFEFAHSQIEGSVSPASGPGWTSWQDTNFVVKQEDVLFKSHGISSPKHLEGAVKRKAYPPFISCRTNYRKELRKKGQPTNAVLLIEGAKDKEMKFLCTAYSHTVQEHDAPISGNTSPLRQVSNTPTHTTGSLDLPSNFLEDSDKDFDTPPSTPPEGQVPIGHSTGSPTSDGQGVPSDVGILGVVETITNWEMLALRLGVPLTHVDECKNDTTLGKSRTFDYWRNGRCDREFPITWAFLLECVEKTCGTRVAEELKKRASENPTWTEQ